MAEKQDPGFRIAALFKAGDDTDKSAVPGHDYIAQTGIELDAATDLFITDQQIRGVLAGIDGTPAHQGRTAPAEFTAAEKKEIFSTFFQQLVAGNKFEGRPAGQGKFQGPEFFAAFAFYSQNGSR